MSLLTPRAFADQFEEVPIRPRTRRQRWRDEIREGDYVKATRDDETKVCRVEDMYISPNGGRDPSLVIVLTLSHNHGSTITTSTSDHYSSIIKLDKNDPDIASW